MLSAVIDCLVADVLLIGFLLLRIFRNVSEWNRNAIFLCGPPTEIEDTAALGAKRTIGISFPCRGLPANRTLHSASGGLSPDGMILRFIRSFEPARRPESEASSGTMAASGLAKRPRRR